MPQITNLIAIDSMIENNRLVQVFFKLKVTYWHQQIFKQLKIIFWSDKQQNFLCVFCNSLYKHDFLQIHARTAIAIHSINKPSLLGYY